MVRAGCACAEAAVAARRPHYGGGGGGGDRPAHWCGAAVRACLLYSVRRRRTFRTRLRSIFRPWVCVCATRRRLSALRLLRSSFLYAQHSVQKKKKKRSRSGFAPVRRRAAASNGKSREFSRRRFRRTNARGDGKIRRRSRCRVHDPFIARHARRPTAGRSTVRYRDAQRDCR